MRKADLTVGHGLDAFWHPLSGLTDRDQVGGNSTGLVAGESDPVDRGPIPLRVVLICSCKTSRRIGGTEKPKVHLMERVGHIFGSLCACGRLHVLRREHKKRLPNKRSPVNRFDRKNGKNHAPSPTIHLARPAPPPPPLPRPSPPPTRPPSRPQTTPTNTTLDAPPPPPLHPLPPPPPPKPLCPP